MGSEMTPELEVKLADARFDGLRASAGLFVCGIHQWLHFVLCAKGIFMAS